MGLIVKMYDEMNENAKNSFNKKHPLYDSLEEYIDNNQGFDDLVIENYENIFRIYTISSSIILIIFFLRHYSKSCLTLFKKVFSVYRNFSIN